MPGAFSTVILAGLGFFACGFVLAFWLFGRVPSRAAMLGAGAVLAAIAAGSGYILTYRVPALGPNPQGAPIAPAEISQTLHLMMWLAILTATAVGGALASFVRAGMIKPSANGA